MFYTLAFNFRLLQLWFQTASARCRLLHELVAEQLPSPETIVIRIEHAAAQHFGGGVEVKDAAARVDTWLQIGFCREPILTFMILFPLQVKDATASAEPWLHNFPEHIISLFLISSSLLQAKDAAASVDP